MLDFSDSPYEFYPAKPNRFLIWAGQMYNKRYILPGDRHRISSVEVSGGECLKGIVKRRNTRLLFLPNHPTHSDAQVVFETHRQLGTMSCFMTAYDVMQRNRRLRWLMQRGGCFSIDRDGNDRISMKSAIEILTDGTFDLTIFPEGNVYLMNDSVTPFQAGAAFIAMKAQKELNKGESVFLVPVSIKATHLEDVRRETLDILKKLATESGTELAEDGNLVNGLQRIGVKALENALRHRGIFPNELQGDDIGDLIKQSAALIIEQLEKKMEMSQAISSDLLGRIRKIRGRIHEIRTDTNQRGLAGVAATWADEAITAMRILSYTGSYVSETPSLDRYCETVEKLYEDIYGTTLPPAGDRHALVRINEPIDLAGWMDSFRESPRKCVLDLTNQVENRVQDGVNELNANNNLPGCERFQLH